MLQISIHEYKGFYKTYIVNSDAITSANEHSFNQLNKGFSSQTTAIYFHSTFQDGYTATLPSIFSTQYISNPIQVMRITDVVSTYIVRIQKILGSKNAVLERINQAINNQAQYYFKTHELAAIYLRNYVQGEKVKINTPYGVRIIDAMDNQSIAHQAFLTFKEKQLYEQLKKDIWLLQKGKKVNGIVWHFFKKENAKNKGPSQKFMKYAQSKGVIIYIHSPE